MEEGTGNGILTPACDSPCVLVIPASIPTLPLPLSNTGPLASRAGAASPEAAAAGSLAGVIWAGGRAGGLVSWGFFTGCA